MAAASTARITHGFREDLPHMANPGERRSVTEPSHAVFLSYASQDAQAAQAICKALRAAGIEVWFDQSELRGGDLKFPP